jgi:3-phenylpropionate/trans-cinnamate dioxygenase ferredoxin reductase component
VSAGTLIVGASQAGLQLAVSLRELGYDDPITMVGEEDHAPYQRPPLSKAFLGGGADQESLAFRTPAFYADTNIDLLRGERITKLTLAADDVSVPTTREGGTAITNTGRTLRFDRLALAVGARPRRLYLPGAQLDGVHYLRDVDEAEQLRSGLDAARDVVVIGGGFIGLEAAAVARAGGKSVTVIEAADRLISRAVAPVVSDFYEQAHTRRGVRVLLSVGAREVVGTDGKVTGVRLTDGSVVPADVVLVGIGVVPRTMLARQLRLECDGGIVVDRYARTSAPGVVAAGDCTVMPHPLTGEGRVRLESVENAVAQARVAAATLVGRLDDTRAVPWFWSDQGDLKLQIAGLSNGYDQHVLRGDPDTERFAVLYYRDGRLIAVDAVNQPADYMAVRKALTRGANIPADQAADAGTALKTLIVEDAGTHRAGSGPAA